MSNDHLASKVALVTGGGRGLGEAICRCLAEAGMRVVAADLRIDLAEVVAAEVLQHGGDGAALRLDVSDEDQAEAAVQEVVSRFGRLDVLVNNAGVDVTLPVSELTISDWDRVLAVNLRGPFMMSKFALA